MKGVVIKWRNRWSGEEGYVKSISTKNGHFVNTFNIKDAHRYERKCTISNAMNALQVMGETENNDFYLVEVK